MVHYSISNEQNILVKNLINEGFTFEGKDVVSDDIHYLCFTKNSNSVYIPYVRDNQNLDAVIIEVGDTFEGDVHFDTETEFLEFISNDNNFQTLK
jgi:hypothetical protein